MSRPAAAYGILVAVDGSRESDAAVRWAAAEAALRDLPITLMHVVAPVAVRWPVGYLESDYRHWQEDEAARVIEQARNTVRSGSAGRRPVVQTEVRHGQVAAELVDASTMAMMTVVGSRGLGAIGGGLLGSVSRGLLHYAHAPVAVIHAAERPTGATSPVLVGVDGSPASEAATAMAFDEASRRGVDLVALHAWSDVSVVPATGPEWNAYEQLYQQDGSEILAERLAGWQERYPDVSVRRRIVCDRPAHWLIDESANAQLVVLGCRGRGGFARMLLGSVSTAVAESATTPVLVVRSGPAGPSAG